MFLKCDYYLWLTLHIQSFELDIFCHNKIHFERTNLRQYHEVHANIDLHVAS